VLMVILGAGASYDSSPDRLPIGLTDLGLGHRPPLAANLFEVREHFAQARAQFPQFHELIAHLLPQDGRSIEEVLQEFQDDAPRDPRRYVQLAAIRYYLQQAFKRLIPQWMLLTGGVLNHITLLDKIRSYVDPHEPVLFVTFNYDTLLEEALFKHDKRITFGKIDDYVLGRVPDRFRVFKLHGSVNWGRCLTSGPSVVTQSQQARGPWGSAEIMIENAAALGLSDDYCVVTDDKAGFVGPPLFPAIAIPVVSKATFECPPAHVDMLRNLIPEVDRILAIGWRANERDFLNMLRDMNAASIVTMCGPHSGDTLERLRGLSFRVKPNPMALDGFSRSVTDSRLNAFLAGDSFAKTGARGHK